MRMKPLRVIIETLIIASFSLAAQSADAGPWLREKGSSFMAASFASTYYLDTASQTYLEYGLTETTTMVADIGFLRPRYSLGGGYATLSMRRALGQEGTDSKWAYELGAGIGWLGSDTLPHVRTALSWGRGLTWGEKSGWATIEAAVIWDLAHEHHVTKVDSTLGLNFTEVTAGMLQIYTAYVQDDTIATIAPSVIFSPKKSKFRIQIGAESEIGNMDNSAVKFGLWREF